MHHITLVNLVTVLHRVISDYMGIHALSDLLLYPVKSTAAYEKYMPCIHRNHLLVGMLAATLWGHIHNGTFQQFQQALLYAFAS